jgi:hypothetical protein
VTYTAHYPIKPGWFCALLSKALGQMRSNTQELWILGRARLEVPWLGGSSEALTETVRYLPH